LPAASTESDGSTACSALEDCCGTLSGSAGPSCSEVVSDGSSASCTSALEAYVESGQCSGGASSGSTSSIITTLPGSSGSLASTGTNSSSGSSLSSGGGSSSGGGAFGSGSAPSVTPGSGNPCTGTVGGFATSTCDPSDEQACSGGTSGCTISPACGDVTTCEPFATNAGPNYDFRMRGINIIAPTTLANQVVQNEVITASVDLPATSSLSCGENGTGTLNWLIRVNPTAGTVETGGAPVSTDPAGQGYCFTNATVSGVAVSPATSTGISVTGSTFSSSPASDVLNIPIYGGLGGAGVVVLPIRGAAFHDVTVSNGGSCIGAISTAGFQVTSNGGAGACTDPEPSGADSCSHWHTAGSLAGFINLKDADAISVATLGGESLCVLLTGDNDGANPPKCTSAGLTAGDYCSTSDSVGGCRDSVWFSITFAASAVSICGGT